MGLGRYHVVSHSTRDDATGDDPGSMPDRPDRERIGPYSRSITTGRSTPSARGRHLALDGGVVSNPGCGGDTDRRVTRTAVSPPLSVPLPADGRACSIPLGTDADAGIDHTACFVEDGVLATGFEPAVAQPVSSSRTAVRRRYSPTVARRRGLLGEFEKRSATDTDAPPRTHRSESRRTLVADCTLV
jgi:hypothetical protein